MVATVYAKRLPADIPGTLTRSFHVVEPVTLDSSYLINFGQSVVFENDKARPFKQGDSVGDLAGFLARSVPLTASRYLPDVPDVNLVLSVIVLGYIGVLCKNGVPTRNRKVFIRLVDSEEFKAGELETEFEYEIKNYDVPEEINIEDVVITEDAEAGEYKLYFTGEYYDVYLPSGAFVGAGKIGEAFNIKGVSFLIEGVEPPENTVASFEVVKITDVVSNIRWAVSGKDGNNRAEIFIK